MAVNTGAPWNLLSPVATEQPDGPAQLAELAQGVHAALGRAYPCVSTARPDPVAGLLIFETDTDTLLISTDGTTWKSVWQAAGTATMSQAVLTAAANFTIVEQVFYRSGGLITFEAEIQRTTSTISAGGDGNITAVAMATVAAAWRPPPNPVGAGNGWQINCGGDGGKMAAGYVHNSGTMYVGALLPGTAGDWTTAAGGWVWGGTYPAAE